MRLFAFMTEKSVSLPLAKIVRFHELGGAEVLKLEELPLPEPGPGEVRLRVEAIGLNRAEVVFRMGRYFMQPKLASKLGYEASGVVEAVGPGVDAGLIGKRRSTVPAFAADAYGVYGEVAIVPAQALAAYPENLTPEEGTSIWMQYLTSYGALVQHGKLAKGDFVVITAASSSVGLASIEIARAQGATSIATTRTAAKKAELLELGADHVIVTQEEDLVARVKEITGGKGARIIFDPVAGPGVEALAKAAAHGGTVFIYGGLSGQPTPFPIMAAMAKSLCFRGYTLFDVVSNPDLRATAQQYVYDHLKDGSFKPRIAKTFPLSQIVEAHRYMESNEQVGKIVVTVGR
jgi:NADPH:quinone reductase-like Zn-dependent oxidoreductase